MSKISEIYLGGWEHKTVIFEGKYGVNIRDYSTTTEVDKYIESQIGREPRIINSDMKSYDINGLFDETIENIDD